MKDIVFALPKGRLAEKTMDILAQIGITCPEMNEEGTRKLLFKNEDLGYRFFLAKPSDVPTYVEYGAADIIYKPFSNRRTFSLWYLNTHLF